MSAVAEARQVYIDALYNALPEAEEYAKERDSRIEKLEVVCTQVFIKSIAPPSGDRKLQPGEVGRLRATVLDNNHRRVSDLGEIYSYHGNTLMLGHEPTPSLEAAQAQKLAEITALVDQAIANGTL